MNSIYLQIILLTTCWNRAGGFNLTALGSPIRRSGKNLMYIYHSHDQQSSNTMMKLKLFAGIPREGQRHGDDLACEMILETNKKETDSLTGTCHCSRNWRLALVAVKSLVHTGTNVV